MNPALLSLLALGVAIVLSMTSRINVGLLAIALTWIIGIYVAALPAATVVGGFPTSLFLTLAGVTLLFAAAEANGTLERLAGRAVLLARGDGRVIPLVFFVVAFLVSMIGPGAISSVALIIPLAMAIAVRTGIPALLISLMVANGANAGNLSPFSSVGIIANSAMARAGLEGHEWRVFAANLAAHSIVAAGAYVMFGGLRLGRSRVDPAETARALAPLQRAQLLTLGVIGTWIASVVLFQVHLGLSAFAATTILLLARVADESAAIRKVPWGIILMVCGVSLLIALLETTGGMELFTTLLSRLATPSTVNGVIAFVTGVISSYSSTSGVVLPAFLPTVGGLVEKLGGGDPLAIALSINVGSALVDVSPLSTLGALCVAALADHVQSRVLFRQLLAWGLSMSVVGGILCQLFAGAMAGRG